MSARSMPCPPPRTAPTMPKSAMIAAIKSPVLNQLPSIARFLHVLRAGRRIECAHVAIDRIRARAPVDDRFGRGQLGRVGRALFGLCLRRQASATAQCRQRLYDRSRAYRSEFVVETARSLARTDRN